MDLDTLRSLPPEERERILEIQVDFSLVTDALNMCAYALHGIIEAETVAEVTPEDMNDAETALPKATEALARLREEFERHDKHLEAAKIGFSEHVCKLRARIKELEGAIRYHRESLSSGQTISELNDRLGGPGGELVCPPEQRVASLEKLCRMYYEALEIDLGNVRSLKAASPGVRTFDEWEKGLAHIVEHHPGSYRCDHRIDRDA